MGRTKNYPIEEWLKQLPIELRDKALAYFYGKHGAKDSNNTVDNMADAIASAFTWGLTKEGGDYWHTYYKSYLLRPVEFKPFAITEITVDL